MAAERIAAVEKLLTDLGAQVLAIGDKVDALASGSKSTQQRVLAMEEAHTDLTVKLDSYSRMVESQKDKLVKNINEEFEKHELALNTVVEQAKQEFDKTRVDLNGLYGQSSDAFATVRLALEELREEVERSKSQSGGNATGSVGTSHRRRRTIGSL